jgi:hypothetical protein
MKRSRLLDAKKFMPRRVMSTKENKIELTLETVSRWSTLLRRSAVIDAQHFTVMCFEQCDLLENVKIEYANVAVSIADCHR